MRKQKEKAIERNRVSDFSREMECKVVARETSTFLQEWLRYYDGLNPEDYIYTVMWIDPVPPPSPTEIAKGMKDKDYECIAVVSRVRGGFYVREYTAKHGHDPSWTIMEFFRLANIYRPRRIFVESVAYQRTLAWLLRKAMEQQRKYYIVEEVTDKRKKYHRIVDGLSGPAANNQLFVKKEMSEFVSQYCDYPNVSHDDILESVAGCVEKLSGAQAEDAEESWDELMDEEKEMPKLVYRSRAP